MKNETGELIITPDDLKFRFQPGRAIPTQIVLHNPTEERFAFKVKTTSPKKYCVRPSAGFVDPKSNRQVEVIMQSQKEYPDLGACKDKFLLQSVAAPGFDKELTTEMFDRASGHIVKESKLKVILEGPRAPPAPIEEENLHGDDITLLPAGKQQVVHVEQNGGPIAKPDQSQVLKKLREDYSALQKKINMLNQESQPIPLTASQKLMGKGGFTLLHLILTALLAFLLGHFTS